MVESPAVAAPPPAPTSAPSPSAGIVAAPAAEPASALVAAPRPSVPLADDPLAPALAALAEAPATDPEVWAFYAARGHAPLWLAGDGAAATALLAALDDAGSHALPAARYGAAALRAEAARPETEARAAAELALTSAFLTYARDLSSGVVEPRRVARMIDRSAPRPAPAALLRDAAAAVDMAAHLAALAPADPDYARLRARWTELHGAAAAPAAPKLADGPTLRPGERDPRVAALRARVAALGFDAGPAPADAARYDEALVAAVMAFQRAEGLSADGAVGRLTRAALNRDSRAEALQIAANLERLRWLNFDLGARRIVVNQPEFRVRLIDGDAVLFDERVVVGTVENQTAEFSDEMEYLVLNPTWHVPRSIAIGEILPALQQDPFYLQNRGMRLVRTDGGEAPADPTMHDFSQYTAESFPYRIRQTPDDDNALGLVKFMFPNDHAIYLHDTPKKKLFDRDSRAFSHGCVRVRDPLSLARALLAPQEADAAGFVQKVLATGRERYVHLDAPVPVHLLYRTVTVDEGGRLRFHADVYGRDARLIEALIRAGVASPEA